MQMLSLTRTGLRFSNLVYFLGLMLLLSSSCRTEQAPSTDATESESVAEATISREPYGKTGSGEAVELFRMRNAQGMAVDVITYGAIITAISVSDQEGKFANVVLGFDSLEQYLAGNPYFGAVVGRYGNRIAGGKFSLDGKSYQLETNNGPNHLHGGVSGLDKVVWQPQIVEVENGVALALSYTSPDGAGGYPGTLQITTTYTLSNDNELVFDYEATSDKGTIVNLTQHSYFNLSGDANADIGDHVLQIAADTYLPVDATLIPKGEMRMVAGTPFDFTRPKAIGQEIDADDEQLSIGKGYDHCWVLSQNTGEMAASTLYHPGSGRRVEIFTTEPGIQFYSGNFLDGTLPQPGGGYHAFRSGLCLETQHFPDSPNRPDFPSVTLQPGERYASQTRLLFSVQPL